MLFKVDPDPDPGKEIEVDPDPDPDPRRGSKWIRIRIRPNVVDPGGSGSGSGSETLVLSGHLFQRGLTLILILLSALFRAVGCPYLFPRCHNMCCWGHSDAV